MLEWIPLPLMYNWYWILFLNAGCFCSVLTPGDIGCLDFYSSKCGGKFSKWTMGAEAGFGPIFDWVSFCLYVFNKLITIDIKLGFNGMQCN